jgi:hypothetical protein
MKRIAYASVMSVLLCASRTGSLHAVQLDHAGELERIEVRLAYFKANLPVLFSIPLHAIANNAVFVGPTRRLARMSNRAVREPGVAHEVKHLMFQFIQGEPPSQNTLVVLRGQKTDVLILAPSHILAIVQPGERKEAVRLTLKMLGVYDKMLRTDHARLRRL